MHIYIHVYIHCSDSYPPLRACGPQDPPHCSEGGSPASHPPPRPPNWVSADPRPPKKAPDLPRQRSNENQYRIPGPILCQAARTGPTTLPLPVWKGWKIDWDHHPKHVTVGPLLMWRS